MFCSYLTGALSIIEGVRSKQDDARSSNFNGVDGTHFRRMPNLVGILVGVAYNLRHAATVQLNYLGTHLRA